MLVDCFRMSAAWDQRRPEFGTSLAESGPDLSSRGPGHPFDKFWALHRQKHNPAITELSLWNVGGAHLSLLTSLAASACILRPICRAIFSSWASQASLAKDCSNFSSARASLATSLLADFVVHTSVAYAVCAPPLVAQLWPTSGQISSKLWPDLGYVCQGWWPWGSTRSTPGQFDPTRVNLAGTGRSRVDSDPVRAHVDSGPNLTDFGTNVADSGQHVFGRI